jgi:hypothetical protein
MDLNSNQKTFDPKKKEEGIASLFSFSCLSRPGSDQWTFHALIGFKPGHALP